MVVVELGRPAMLSARLVANSAIAPRGPSTRSVNSDRIVVTMA